MFQAFKRRSRREMAQVQGLVQVLFKTRNGQDWTEAERAFLKRELRGLAGRWAPGFFLFLLPGGMLLLPAYAWFLDQRTRGVVRVGGQRTEDPTALEAVTGATGEAPARPARTPVQ
jgi:hypothetical protein